MKLSLYTVLTVKFHIVPQIVKAELIIRAVGYICAIGTLSFLFIEMMQYDSHAQTEKCVDSSHPLGVSASEIIIDGHYVYPVTGEGI